MHGRYHGVWPIPPCTAVSNDGFIAGYLLASGSGRSAMLGMAGELEEPLVRAGPHEPEARRALVGIGGPGSWVPVPIQSWGLTSSNPG
ncbi:MAG TPA: hypothetical protein VLA90_01885 [Actinomycetota bacterium]|nr:hypothetical protein [Actinomycetota bacterium]